MERRTFLGGSGTGGMAMVHAPNLTGHASDPTSDLPAEFRPSAYALPPSEFSPFTTPDYYTYSG